VKDEMIQAAVAAFARGNELVEPEELDDHLSEIADKAAGTLLKDRHRRDFPHAAYDDLLSTVAALRAVLGFTPTPTAAEVLEWHKRQPAAYGRATEGRAEYLVVFLDGPYQGVEMALEGPVKPYPEEGDPLGYLVGEGGGWIAGPLAYVPLPVHYGPEGQHGYTSVRYKRGDAPLDDGRWPYRLRTDDPAPPEDARPAKPYAQV
jgi:hypothetical protein